MPLPNEFITISGPITAAIIAGSISFIITILSKDQKTSEFRQAWIDALRSEISELLSLVNVYCVIINQKVNSNDSNAKIFEYLYSKQDDLARIANLITTIKLRSNPKEHAEFIYMLDHLDNLSMNQTSEENAEHRKNMTIESQRILKKEWSRVKAGELSFRLIKWGSLSILIFSLGLATLFFNEYITITYTPK